VLSTLDATRPLFTSYLRIRSIASSATSLELVQARNELETNLQDLSTDLQDLVDSVRAAEKDPFRYGLDVEEVARRRRLVEEVGGEIEDMREELAKAVAGSQAKGAMGLPSPSTFDADYPDEDGYAALEQQRQVEILHEQDETLDGVFKTVGTLREQAHVMGRELEEQGEMLDEVDTLADRVGGKLQGGMKRITTIIQKNEGHYKQQETNRRGMADDTTDTWSSCCIGILIFVLILLLILVIAL
jgi:t-SNARE syntaxin family protein